MDIKLEANEAGVLRQVLSNFAGDLRMEIADTDKYEVRDSLKEDEEALKSILKKLGIVGYAELLWTL